MSIIKRFLVILCVITATVAVAQIDSDPDGIGIYFDQDATSVSTIATEGTFSVAAYLVMTNPTYQGALYYWEAYVATYAETDSGTAAISGDPSLFFGSNLGTNTPGSSHWGFQVFIQSPPPYLTSPITVLAHLEIWPNTFVEPINLYVWEGATYTVSDVGTALMNPSSGDWLLPSAVVNGPAPVSSEPSTWGAVKSIFR